MDINDKHIVAIDLGTSKIALTVAKVNGEDIQVIYYRETPSEGVRYSSVFNVRQVTEPLRGAIRQAEEELGIKITQAVVGMPKFPIRQESSNAEIHDRGHDTDITPEDVDNLKDFAKSLYPLEDETKEAIYGAVAQSFSDGENFQIIESDIIGMTSDTLEGNFKIFIGKKSDLTKIDTVMTRVEVAAMRKYFTAESTAKAVLTNSEMENGVALIDFGGGSTSVSIYHGNIMRHYASFHSEARTSHTISSLSVRSLKHLRKTSNRHSEHVCRRNFRVSATRSFTSEATAQSQTSSSLLNIFQRSSQPALKRSSWRYSMKSRTAVLQICSAAAS